MKKYFYFIFLFSVAVIAGCTPRYVATVPPPQRAEVTTEVAPEPVTYQEFYDDLGPYGRWIEYPNEGYVWSPNVDPSFKPYSTNGHWVYSDEGWTWVSDFQWGWGPFHYGNWFYDDSYGWLWLPGTQWAPAWVTWGHSGEYYGWAPVPPHVDERNGWRPREQDWSFVPQDHINRPQVSNYIVDKSTNVNIVKNVTIINNVHNNINNTTINNTNNNTVNNKNTTTNVNNTNINNTNVNNTNVNNNTNNINVNHRPNEINTPVISTPPVNKNDNNPVNTPPNSNMANNGNNKMPNRPTVRDLKDIHAATVVNRGPQIDEVANVTNAPITKVNINETNKPAKPIQATNNRLIMYRPVVRAPQQQQMMNQPKPVPHKIEPYNAQNKRP